MTRASNFDLYQSFIIFPQILEFIDLNQTLLATFNFWEGEESPEAGTWTKPGKVSCFVQHKGSHITQYMLLSRSVFLQNVEIITYSYHKVMQLVSDLLTGKRDLYALGG